MTALIMNAAVSALLLQIGCTPKRPEPAAALNTTQTTTVPAYEARRQQRQRFRRQAAEEIQQAEGKSRRILEACEYMRNPYDLKCSHRLDRAIQQAKTLLAPFDSLTKKSTPASGPASDTPHMGRETRLRRQNGPLVRWPASMVAVPEVTPAMVQISVMVRGAAVWMRAWNQPLSPRAGWMNSTQ